MCDGSTLLKDEQIAAFFAIVDQQGLTKDDFSVVELALGAAADGFGTMSAKVVVHRKSTDIRIIYIAEHASHWLDAFEFDLRRGAYTADDAGTQPLSAAKR